MSEPVHKQIRLPSMVMPTVQSPVASVKHGYLWIGGKNGPCVAIISGKKTLHRLGRMLLRYAR